MPWSFYSPVVSPIRRMPKQAISRVLFKVIIYLGPMLPSSSSGLPEGCGGGPPLPSYLALHRVGFAKLSRSLGRLVRSYRTFSPLLRVRAGALHGAVCFLWHFPFPPHRGDVRVTDHPALWCSDFPLRQNGEESPEAERSPGLLWHQHIITILLLCQ